jgi:hypothetical protein
MWRHVLKRAEFGKSPDKLGENLPGSVGATVVHNDELVWHIAKTQFNMKMLYSRSDAVFFVPRRNYDRKE